MPSTPGDLPLVDVSTWLNGTWNDESSAAVDEALRTTGFLLASGHDVPAEFGAAARRAARRFFGLPDDVKARYVSEAPRGWKPPATVANAQSVGIATLTINTGDLLSLWTGDRWRSTKHQVPAPSADAPKEELLSLVFFYDVDPTALIEMLPAPVAGPQHDEPVLAGDYLLSKINAIQTA